MGGTTMMLRFLAALAGACLLFVAGASAQSKTELLWYSQAAFKITTPGGKVIMIDPWIMGATKIPPELVPRMNKGGTIEPFPSVKITMTHAEHSSEMILKDPATGKDTSYPAGEPVGFIIQLENGFKIYHMGDTGLFGDMKFIGDYYKPDLVLVPIGGHYVMDPKDAAYATKELIKPKMAWPMHYASNPFLKGTPAEYKAALGQTTVQVIDAEPGTKKTF